MGLRDKIAEIIYDNIDVCNLHCVGCDSDCDRPCNEADKKMSSAVATEILQLCCDEFEDIVCNTNDYIGERESAILDNLKQLFGGSECGEKN